LSLKCYICDKNAIAICADCYGGVCEDHSESKWGKFYCEKHNPSTKRAFEMKIQGQKKNDET